MTVVGSSALNLSLPAETLAGSDRAMPVYVPGRSKPLISQRWLLRFLISLGQMTCCLIAVAIFARWFHGNLSDVTPQQIVDHNQQTVTAFATLIQTMGLRGLVLGLTFVGGCGLLNMAIMCCYENRLGNLNTDLEQTVGRQTSALLRTRDAMIFGLARLADSRDNETGEHLERIRGYVRLLVEHLAHSDPRLDHDFQQTLVFASMLHDIGKVGIPDAILLKPGKLSPAERAVMQQHTIIGGECLGAIRQRLGEDDFLEMACEIAIAHHERWDGRGYPYGLAGTRIPLSARIVALADHYDALTSRRVYKLAMSHDEARKLIIAESGEQLDPRIVEAFVGREEEFRRIAEQTGQPADVARDALCRARQIANKLGKSVEHQAASIAGLGSELTEWSELPESSGVDASQCRTQPLIQPDNDAAAVRADVRHQSRDLLRSRPIGRGLPRVCAALASQAAERTSNTTPRIVLERAEQAMQEAQLAGGNAVFTRDRENCPRVSEDRLLLELS